jgi:phthalate 4,5-cis-dihydrodiol dehydrogenase
MGAAKDPAAYGSARRRLAGIAPGGAEAALRSATGYGGADAGAPATPPVAHPHFGTIVVSCERGDLRVLPDAVVVYGDETRTRRSLPAPGLPRAEVIDALWDAVVDGRAPRHDGAWGKATLEICAALLRSARERREVPLRHQGARARRVVVAGGR